MGCVERVKALDDPHEIMLNNFPTTFEEDAREAIRPGSLVPRHCFYGRQNLILGDGITEIIQVMRLDIKLIPIKVNAARACSAHDLGKVVMDDVLFLLMVGDPALCVFYPMDVIFPSPRVDAAVENFCVSIPVLQVRNPSALALSYPL